LRKEEKGTIFIPKKQPTESPKGKENAPIAHHEKNLLSLTKKGKKSGQEKDQKGGLKGIRLISPTRKERGRSALEKRGMLLGSAGQKCMHQKGNNEDAKGEAEEFSHPPTSGKKKKKEEV